MVDSNKIISKIHNSSKILDHKIKVVKGIKSNSQLKCLTQDLRQKIANSEQDANTRELLAHLLILIWEAHKIWEIKALVFKAKLKLSQEEHHLAMIT